MRQSFAQSPTVARRLFECGKLDAGGELRLVESSSVYAYFAAIVFLTEPTRLVVRRDAGVGGALKWHIADLINILPVVWDREKGGVTTTQNIVAACLRQQLVRNYYRQIRAGAASKAVIEFRSSPPSILQEIHQVLARRITEAPLRLTFPEPHRQSSVPETLVRQCLLLPYDERRQLFQAVWQGGDTAGHRLDVVRLVSEVRKLSQAHVNELKQMLL